MGKTECELARQTIREAAEKWPTTFVSRKELGKFCGGLVSPRTMANLDCIGKGPKEAFRIGRQIAYPVSSLIEWLEERIQKRRCEPVQRNRQRRKADNGDGDEATPPS